jgi:hypothetical protein
MDKLDCWMLWALLGISGALYVWFNFKRWSAQKRLNNLKD